METRIDTIFHRDTNSIKHGVSVKISGQWHGLTEKGVPWVGNHEEATAKRAEVEAAEMGTANPQHKP